MARRADVMPLSRALAPALSRRSRAFRYHDVAVMAWTWAIAAKLSVVSERWSRRAKRSASEMADFAISAVFTPVDGSIIDWAVERCARLYLRIRRGSRQGASDAEASDQRNSASPPAA